jgi:hypothetical protein
MVPRSRQASSTTASSILSVCNLINHNRRDPCVPFFFLFSRCARNRTLRNANRRPSPPTTAPAAAAAAPARRSSRVDKRNRSVDDKLHIASDASTLLEKFRAEFDSTAREFSTKPRVLVAGCTGSRQEHADQQGVWAAGGADVGSGVPVTQHFDRYELENESVVIYDSKGLEVGEHDNFMRPRGEFFAKARPRCTSSGTSSTRPARASSRSRATCASRSSTSCR